VELPAGGIEDRVRGKQRAARPPTVVSEGRQEPSGGVAIGVAGAEQFNRLMWQAQRALSAFQAVCYLEPLAESDTIVNLLERLIVLKTAFRAATMRSWERPLP
jgi:hypothetical protein